MLLGIPAGLMSTPDFDRGMNTRLAELAEPRRFPQYSLERFEDLIALFDGYSLEEQLASLIRLDGASQADDDQMITMANIYLGKSTLCSLISPRCKGAKPQGCHLINSMLNGKVSRNIFWYSAMPTGWRKS